MSQDVKPTRSELQKLKQRIKLANSGYNLLKKKRDGLIMDFFEVLKQAKTLRQDMTEEYIGALKKMNIARVLETDQKIKSMAMAVKQKPMVALQTKNIMGVVVPKIESQHKAKHFLERGYGTIDSSAAIDEAAEGYEKVVEKIIKAAEVETALKKLLVEIEKTKRRVNALEFSVIPKLEDIKAFITMRLEEMERESTFRMKRIKQK
ncbi:V-type ATP synthase subunit D [Candidatus Woesearchaeota archaeon]|jgi:V/A-type H+/Na+-transporting ATPase subunit D|nr:V-type ATP synthase subunit D [Candidatus Woesearchaeota archaeon]MBT5273036.1 V-type ATP synthase subunit D [Candidatus Woesearchaeota archaeon]MBT6040828.1 V-type ATP synthase subunit D [Candidatus Woesearchaeota archaeon]MBT6337649.1 V-type ATP synthase subunit D [Candidatus Woesearchaeota archaeon]MBT7926950.1 V-type ATP synthase subunit D [Candidatus Woesearchaeota archaeon]